MWLESYLELFDDEFELLSPPGAGILIDAEHPDNNANIDVRINMFFNLLNIFIWFS